MSLGAVLGHLAASAALTDALIRLGRRYVEFFFLYPVALRRTREISSLAACVEQIFRERTSLFSRVGWNIRSTPGFGVQANGDRDPTCWETPVGITVYIAGKPALVMGVEFHGATLCVRQLQGIAGTKLDKNLQDWPKLFVQACTEFALASGIKRVRIYRADQGLFYHFPANIVRCNGETLREAKKSLRQRMRRRYDGTARQLHFIMKRSYGEWTNPNCARP